MENNTSARSTWRKSSYSSGSGTCVEIGHTATTFGMRDSKLPRSPVLAIAAEHGQAFLSAVKTGRFDL